jgi:glycosyltransferase involved in cell wall biosynthesis
MKRRPAPQRLFVVIPAYNEAATIADIARRALPHAEEVIVVDDGSADATADALAGIGVTVLRHKRNLGKGASLAAGIAHALDRGADAVLTLDGDGQHEPEDIPRLVRAWARDPAAVVIGARLRRAERAPRLRKVANRMGDFFIGWACGQPIDDSQSGFRLYPAALLRRLRVPSGPGRGFVFESEMLVEAARAGALIRSVAIESIYRSGARPSHFRPAADFAAISRMLFAKIASRGFHPVGLYRSLAQRPRRVGAEGKRTARADP